MLTAIATLLSNPKVQANPALLAEVQGLNRTAIALISEIQTPPIAQPEPVTQYAPDNQAMPNLGEVPPPYDGMYVCYSPDQDGHWGPETNKPSGCQPGTTALTLDQFHKAIGVQ